jgi:ribA/ribD-fused uncharacterized protein
MSREQIDMIKIHTESMVKGFFDDYRWLSNYHVCTVEHQGLFYTSSEAAYQAAKVEDPYVKSLYQQMDPSESKKASKKYPVKQGWDNIKKGIMYEILLDKFTRNPDLHQKLLETGSKYLEETNYWNDTYWGVCEGRGKNTLGELLMKIREQIR